MEILFSPSYLLKTIRIPDHYATLLRAGNSKKESEMSASLDFLTDKCIHLHRWISILRKSVCIGFDISTVFGKGN